MNTLLEKYTYYGMEREKDTAVVSGLILAQTLCARRIIEARTKGETDLVLKIMKDISDTTEEIKNKAVLV